MFTFGRDKEKQSALYYLSAKDPEKQLVLDLVDCIHDYIEGKCPPVQVGVALKEAFGKTAGGGWEQTGTWLRKLCKHDSAFNSLWIELCESPDGKVRFRVACHIDDMSEETATQIYSKLKADKSKKVSSMAETRWNSRKKA